ncbi:PREDICTED: uncharacterized protein LOC106804619 [Priapulus caudatus]|uniref:Uncharacterized protein LOC106804619 n=1 Tax=Priapulus caudatus TaxID=37621 RepID=A0ABM1DN50_PRICU|nr:PREDICTED: uncharacterized protein LOC106804619 [Priapulus caudatus]
MVIPDHLQVGSKAVTTSNNRFRCNASTVPSYISAMLRVGWLLGITLAILLPAVTGTGGECAPCSSVISDCCQQQHERCEADKFGNKQCSCLYGYMRPPSQTSSDACLPVTSRWTELYFDLEWNDNYKVPGSPELLNLEASLIILVERVMNQSEAMHNEFAHIHFMAALPRYVHHLNVTMNSTDGAVTDGIQADMLLSYLLENFTGFAVGDMESVLDTGLRSTTAYTGSVLITAPDQFNDAIVEELSMCDQRYPTLNYCWENEDVAACTPDESNLWFTCACPPGYTDVSVAPDVDPGEFCEGPIVTPPVPTCSDDYCLNAGTCLEINDNVECSCMTWYSGSRCQTDLTVIVMIIGGVSLIILLSAIAVILCVSRETPIRVTTKGDNWGSNEGQDTSWLNPM